MKKPFTTTISIYLFIGFMLGFNCIANSASIFSSSNINILSTNSPDSIGNELGEIVKTTISDPKDFVIRRKVDFDSHPDGYYTDTQFKSDWRGGKLYMPNTTQIGSVDGKKVLANYYPKGTWGRGGGLNQWVDFSDTPDNITEIYWTFRIKYQDDFDWGLANKLPGVSFGTVQTVASGGDGPNIGNKGSSLRLMWREGGKMSLYVYHHNMHGEYGDDMGIGTFGQLKKGHWQELTVRVVANQVGKANGIMQVWLDGVLVASVQNIEMRTSTSPQTIRGLALHTFMGGADERFAPDKNQFMWMDDIHYWQYSEEFLAENTSVSRGLQLHSASHKLYTPISGAPEEKPNVSPKVSITGPAANAQFIQGDNISITADAADSDGTVTKVDFYNGSTLLGTDISSPYSFNWADLPVGSFSLTAKATDNKGAVTVSGAVNITVAERANVAPSVSITAPNINAQFIQGDNISITADAADSDGTVTRVDFYQGTTLLGTDTSSPYSFNWDDLPVGSFSLTAKATDNKGTTAVSSVVNINVAEKANVAPSVSITAPNANTQFIQGDNISITAEASDPDGTVTKVDFYNGSTLLGTDTSSPYSFNWADLPVGSFSLTAKATDNKGAVTVSSVANIHVVEKANISPKVSITGPAANAQFIQGDNISITADAADSDGTVTRVDFYQGTTLLGTDTSSPYSFNWANLPVGSFSLTAKATDNKGTTAVSSVVNINVVEKANVAPIVSVTAPNTNTQFTEGDNISITAEASDPDGTVTRVDFYNGSTLLGTDTSSPYSFNWDDLPVGSFSLTAKATDNKGTTAVSSVVNINVAEKANVAPSVSITAPNANTQFIQGDNISITAEASDPDGTVTKVDFYTGSTLLGTDTSSPYSFNWADLPVGSFSLTAKATDNKGTTAVSSVVNINVVEKANVAPSVSITAPNANAQFIQGDNISITADAADSDGTVTRVDFYNGSTLLGTDTSSPYSFNWADLPVGSFSLTAKATDNKGTTAVSSVVNINVVGKANVAPSVSITSPKSGEQFIQGDNISITADASDSDGTVTRVDFYNGSTMLGTDTSSPYSFNWEDLPVGSFSLTAKATDNKGAVTVSSAVNINVVEKANVAPKVSITGPAANAQFTEGDNISIAADASDSDGTVTKVDFYQGTTLLGTDISSPYSFNWADLPVGSFSLTAKATDNKGAVTASAVVNITVREKESEGIPVELVIPEVIIISLFNNQEFDPEANVDLMVMFQGSEETVKKVEYYSGNKLIGSSSTSPFDIKWQNPTSGKHIITAKAIGEDSNKFKVSEPIAITIKEKAQTIFQITDPIKDAEFVTGESIAIKVEIPETGNPINRVDYFTGNKKIGSSTTAPYDYLWDNAEEGDHTLVAHLIFTGGTKKLSSPIPIKVLKKKQAIVKLVVPDISTELQSGENIDLNVELVEFENEVKIVEYILESKKLGQAKENPYGFQWKNIPEGNHRIVARATDARGKSYYSEPVLFSVAKDIANPQLDYVIGPNPTTEHLNIIFSNLDGIYDFEFRVVSMNGRVEKTFNVRPEQSTVTIDVSDLINGVYVLQLTANGNEFSGKRFIKK
ncbi:Ig-like domain-containing protein [Algoriphagus sp. NG3]|uniref:T9SS type A sorting domain-containing protein n=1 Tax=Algoriphagus sp. NG3 TaxID=3097546 RepID=UPI002A7FD4B9|nr:Ig-like domain-containing protein [Algoriphagus sp. NG3]WPR73553.1 Ig-like domain-containing protein [Algoriphagus sp. NG3]